MPDLSAPPPLPAHASLFIDFDGTLVDIAPRPDAIVVDAALIALLVGLRDRLPGRVAIVSGRSIEQLDGFFGNASAGLALAGSHGLERRDVDGTLHRPTRPASLDRAAEALHAFAATHDGTIVEPKSLGVAIHYRLAPDCEAAACAITARLGADLGLDVQPGKMMAELKLGGATKGSAIAAFMTAEPFAGTTPVMIGDDLTDEPGFRAAADHGGWGVLVGAPRDTAARHILPDVAAVRTWLSAR